MGEFFRNLFTSDFMPHGHCYYWRPEVEWLHVGSDALIGLSYYSIPVTLYVFVRKRRDLPFNWIFLMFAAFILFCGTTHLLEIWSVWRGTYRFTGLVKLATGLISAVTAVQLVRLVPKALALPSPETWRREVAQRRELERQLIQISAEEQRKLGEDLHDGVGQQITGILLIARNARQSLDEESRSYKDLTTIIDAAQTAQQQVRTLSRGLLPVEVEARGLVGSLEELAVRGKALFRIECQFQCDQKINVSQPVAIQIYKVAQEAVHNGAKHGRATRIDIALSRGPEGVVLTVADDGVGIPGGAEEAGGSGLRMMRHRARIIGGELTITPGAERGAVVKLVVPNGETPPHN